MARRQVQMTRRKHAASRHIRTSSGRSQPSIDWSCPHCLQWFSRKRTGPSHHLKFCSVFKYKQKQNATRSHSTFGAALTPAHSPALSKTSMSPSEDNIFISDSESGSGLDMEPDKDSIFTPMTNDGLELGVKSGFTHRRRTERQTQSKDTCSDFDISSDTDSSGKSSYMYIY